MFNALTPPPMGADNPPFKHTLFFIIDSITSCGTLFMSPSTSYRSKYTGACIASITCSTAPLTNGPIPSQGISVTASGAPSRGLGM
uniref:Isocitrate dehydrogenase NAD regulatory subunit 1-like isoform X2 n=1 Tax=Rhizophora mucronata TaxID=61149 RepID=A0A2P2QED6_RHIMU